MVSSADISIRKKKTDTPDIYYDARAQLPAAAGELRNADVSHSQLAQAEIRFRGFGSHNLGYILHL